MGEDITKGGLPDMGSGRYSEKLSYKEWLQFNNSQRAHYHFIEMAPSTLILLLVSGIYFPIASAALGLALAIFRLLYAIGYSSAGIGATSRKIGTGGNYLVLLAFIGLSIASSIMFISG